MQFYFIFPSFLSFFQHVKLYVHNATKETKTNYKNGARLGMMGVGGWGLGEFHVIKV
jgi:hydrogenase maturation factor HypE